MLVAFYSISEFVSALFGYPCEVRCYIGKFLAERSSFIVAAFQCYTLIEAFFFSTTQKYRNNISLIRADWQLKTPPSQYCLFTISSLENFALFSTEQGQIL